MHLLDYLSGIDFVFEEERRDAGLLFAVDDCPVDGSRTAVLRQERSVEVEGAQGWHVPHHFGQHAEGHDDLQVGMKATQFFEELLIL